MNLYTLASALMLGLSVYCLVVVLFSLNYGISKTDWESSKKKSVFNKISIGIAIWVLIASAIGLTGFFKDFSGLPPRQAFIFIPFILVLLLTFTKTTKEIIAKIPPTWLIGTQSFRVVVEIALWLLFLDGTCPEQMTFEGYNFDILAGLTAPIIVYFCFIKKAWPKSIAILWNIVSLGLLTTIVTIAVLSMPTEFRVFLNEPANTMVADFPIVYLPTILVFTAYTFHLFSLQQLLSSSDTK
ncbi:MAG: hypothetical protein GY810_13390 [Aureispira sp.]|nr:hypothetical protein [Aureispira sp.]